MNRNTLVILMHGKWSSTTTPALRLLEKKLLSENYQVEKPHMPWSRQRKYDQTYHDALTDLSNKIKKYKQQGIERIILMGHSMGANACFAYQAEYNDADAIVALAPGHSPEHYILNNTRHEYLIKKVESKINNNLNKELIKFEDINCSRKRTFELEAEIFYSYFNPQGLGNMVKSASRIKKSIPVLYIEGATDHVKIGPDYVFSKLPYHQYNRYKILKSNHANTPEVSKDIIVEWLNSLIN